MEYTISIWDDSGKYYMKTNAFKVDEEPIEMQEREFNICVDVFREINEYTRLKQAIHKTI